MLCDGGEAGKLRKQPYFLRFCPQEKALPAVRIGEGSPHRRGRQRNRWSVRAGEGRGLVAFQLMIVTPKVALEDEAVAWLVGELRRAGQGTRRGRQAP
jgi:hypothetical protein